MALLVTNFSVWRLWSLFFLDCTECSGDRMGAALLVRPSEKGNRLVSEPECPDSLISSLIHGFTSGWISRDIDTETH